MSKLYFNSDGSVSSFSDELHEYYTTVFSISEDDVQTLAEGNIGRRLTENEMNRFRSKFTVEDWTEIVLDTIGNIKEF